MDRNFIHRIIDLIHYLMVLSSIATTQAILHTLHEPHNGEGRKGNFCKNVHNFLYASKYVCVTFFLAHKHIQIREKTHTANRHPPVKNYCT